MRFFVKQQMHTIFQYRFQKSSLLGAVVVSLVLLAGSATAQNFPHIKTFGFDYIRFADNNGEFLDNLRWAANHHDWVVGTKGAWPAAGIDYLDALTYNTIKETNSSTKIMKYLPYHSVAPMTMIWLENWCVENDKPIEELYYHYYYDTTIRLSNGSTLMVPGFGGGSAQTLDEARLRVRWNGGWVGINPSSQTFREAYQALALHVITLEGTVDVFADGLFLDTVDGIVNKQPNGYTSFLENTIELKDIGTKDEIYAQVTVDMANSIHELKNFLIQKTGNPNFRLQANPAVPRYIYNTFSDLFDGEYRDYLMDLTVEYLVTTTTRINDITYLQKMYDDMDNGRLFFIRSQTNFGPPTSIPFKFTQFALSTHYLINHENAHFMYHYGNAGNYGGAPYGNPKPTHWHQNMEVNIGVPVLRPVNDYWGTANTDRFYVFSGDNVLAREYSNALVLAKFGHDGGWANIGNNPITYQLGDNYYPLLEDNSTGAAVTSVMLGDSEGVILLKNPVIGNLPRPKITHSNFEISP